MTTTPDSPCVLVADDSPVARLTLVRRLVREGLRIVEAGSAAEMIARAATAGDTACALLDLDLGDANGSDLAESLLQTRPGLPIAFFSAESDGASLARARTIGPIFAKPDAIEDAVAWVKAQRVAHPLRQKG